MRTCNGLTLLKGRESFREYTACPVIGSSDSTGNHTAVTENLHRMVAVYLEVLF